MDNTFLGSPNKLSRRSSLKKLLNQNKYIDADRQTQDSIKLFPVSCGISEYDFDEMVILQKVGSGSISSVYLVNFENQFSDQFFALKAMKKSKILDEFQLDHVKEEKSLLERIDHPFSTNILASFQDEQTIYYLTNFYKGGTLWDLVNFNGHLNNDATMFYMTQIIFIVSYLQRNNILYRDLKLENLMIDDEGYLKLIDYGFAKRMDSEKTYTLCGTPNYVAPEMLKCFAQNYGYTKSIDWWSVGIIMYQLLAGFKPFDSSLNSNKIYKNINKGMIIFPQHFTKEQKSVITKFLNYNPTQRLGVKGYATEVFKEKWFKNININEIYEKKMVPPFIQDLEIDTDIYYLDRNIQYRKINEQEQELFNFI